MIETWAKIIESWLVRNTIRSFHDMIQMPPAAFFKLLGIDNWMMVGGSYTLVVPDKPTNGFYLIDGNAFAHLPHHGGRPGIWVRGALAQIDELMAGRYDRMTIAIYELINDDLVLMEWGESRTGLNNAGLKSLENKEAVLKWVKGVVGELCA